MESSRYSPHFQRIFLIAQEHAKRLNHDYLGSEHLLLAITDVEDSIAAQALKKLNVDLRKLRMIIEDAIGVGQSMMLLGELPLSSQAKKIIGYAVEEAHKMGLNYIGSEHLMLALVKDEEGIGARILSSMGVRYQNLKEVVMKLLGDLPVSRETDDEDEEEFEEERPPKPFYKEREFKQSSYKPLKVKTQTLDEFGRDLTELAKNRQLDPVIGRENEMERVIQVLGRRTKNNPVLVGEPGVGKTAIVEGLAQRIVNGEVPETLSGKRLVSLDLAAIVAGTKYRGEFEQRLKTIVDEIRKAKNSIILFIDELHTVIGAGAAEGAIDAANILKPALARGELQCIGATTFDEYRKHIEHDPALERRFQPIIVDPPTMEETIEILKGLKEKYENHHMCIYTDKAIEAAVYLSDRYITDRALPDKAIDLMDEAGSSARLKMSVYPPEFKDKEREIEEIRLKEKNGVILIKNPEINEEFVGVNKGDIEISGNLEILVSTSGMKLYNKSYLEHILPSVVSLINIPKDNKDNYELIKALTVIVRTYFIKQLENKDYIYYDLLPDYKFKGLQYEKQIFVDAARDTQKEVLIDKYGKLYNVSYSINSGGKTKKGVDDNSTKPDILTPFNLYRWIYFDFTKKMVYSIPQNQEDISRAWWIIVLKPKWIEDRVNRYYKLGNIKNIYVLKRDEFGIVKSIKIEGSASNVIIEGEDEVNRFLAGGSLRSNLFYLRQINKGKFPEFFILRGIGTGKFDGLCIDGSYYLSKNIGYTYTSLLKHYFPDGSLKKWK